MDNPWIIHRLSIIGISIQSLVVAPHIYRAHRRVMNSAKNKSGELVTAVQRDALSIQAEEEALCKAEEDGTFQTFQIHFCLCFALYFAMRTWGCVSA